MAVPPTGSSATLNFPGDALTFPMVRGRAIAYVFPMLAGKPWRMEFVLLLAAGLMISLSAGMASIFTLQALAPRLAKGGSEGFIHFLIGTASFQGVALVMLHFFLKAHGATWRELFGFDQPQWRRAVRLGLAFGVVVVPMALLLNKVSYEVIKWIQHAEPQQQLVVTILTKNAHWYQRVCFGIGAVVLAPVVEEVLFRGILYRAIKQQGYPQLALWGSSLFFAAIHSNLLTFLPLLGLALTFALLYERTDTLLAPIATHAVFNAVNFFLLLYAPKLNQSLGLFRL